ncbi:MAG: DUF1501 domain-containing protein [Planctomycetaceae bacterium]|nr:DUF1501 domain-containing protein [Planctomycetaceae bacterium]
MTFQVGRRQFLQVGAGAASVLSLSGPIPRLLQAAASGGRADGRILVVVEMAGGNDGLNTVVPFANDEYRKARPTLAIPADRVLKLSGELGLHPSMRGFADLFDQGRLAVVQGVGYPQPNRSHFESMDIWHTCLRKDVSRPEGWIGRFLDEQAARSGGDPPAMHFGADKQPFALMSRDVRVPSIRSLDEFRIDGFEQDRFRSAVRDLAETRRASDNDLLSFVQSSSAAALATSERIEAAAGGKQTAREWPASPLGQKLQTVARLITTGLQTCVYYVQLDGFDTHARQAAAHEGLLKQLSDAVSVFLEEMASSGDGERVAVLCFSEFGRRVEENASEGTDHGTAAPVFIAGAAVKGGLIGGHPSLSQLEDGDLKFHTDFRQVYAAVLERWMNCDSRRILQGQFSPSPIFV